MTRFPTHLLVFLTLCASLSGQLNPVAATAPLDLQQATSGVTEAKATLDGLPKGAAAGSPNALLRQAWERRVQLFEEAVALFTRSEAQVAAPAEIAARRQANLEQSAQLAALPAPVPVESPTEAGFAELEEQVATQRDLVASLRAEEAAKAQYVEQIPALRAQARARLQSAQDLKDRLTTDATAATDPAQKQLLEIRAANAAMDASVAALRTAVLDKDAELEESLAPGRANEENLAQQRLVRTEQEYEFYRQALAQEIDRAGVLLEQELTRLERALEAAQDPADRFLAAKQLEIARFTRDEAEHGKFLLSLRADLEEQERRLAVEVKELKDLRDYLEKAGTSEQAAERIKFTLRRVKLRRQALQRTLRRDVAAELGDYRSRRFELEDKLFFLKEGWEQEVDATALELSEPGAAAFRAAASAMVEPYSNALRKERDRLTTVISVGQELQVALIERRKALEALEAFLRSKVFWIRDAKPLGPELWPRAVAESEVVTAWGRGLGSPGATANVSQTVARPAVLTMLLFLLIVLPIALYWVRQRLRRFVKRMNDRTVREDARISDRLLAVGGGILSVALLPAFLFIASRSLDRFGLPETLVPVLAGLLGHLAIFFLFWFLSRSFFAKRGTAQVQFGMDTDAAHNLHRALTVLLIGYLVFFSTRMILSRPPFLLGSLPLEILPRFAYTAFLIVAVVAGIVLLQPRSAFTRYWASALGNNFLGRQWPVLGGLLCLVGVGIVALEILGYRYGAGVLARNVVLSLAALLALVPLYKGAVAMVESRARSLRAKRSPGDGADGEPADPEESRAPHPPQGGDDQGASDEDRPELQVRKFLRFLFILGGVVLIASFWGIDSTVFATLDLQSAYDIRDTGDVDEFVSYGDLLRAVLYVLGAYFLLKHLPGIYEYGIFSRLNLDSGIKYAILTMSRYGIFTLAALAILGAFHLDLGRLGWLMAAMGVGLGFGLQEIVSNFVSGIILLVERPVRVGDVVTIGATSGKVQRINIRATSVINFDRQEIIVPNRSLITKEVTNWTRGDTIIRLVVSIGVAYGTDIDQVTSTLLEIAHQQPEILADPGPQAFFLAHGESSLDFELRVFVPDPSLKLPLLHRLNRTINASLAEQGIEIPFPQRDLNIRSSAVPMPAPGSAKNGEH